EDIAAAHALDQASAALRAAGHAHFLLRVGRDWYAAGRRGSRAWTVEVDVAGGRVLSLSDQALSSSGPAPLVGLGPETEAREALLIDPRDARPADGARWALVRARDSVSAR